jgi:hypothetical protein
MKVLVVYHTIYGHTLQLARAVEAGVKSVAGVEAVFPPRAGISPRRERTRSRRRLRHENLEGPKRHPALHPR